MMSWVCDFTRLALRWQLEHGSHTSLPGKTSYFADSQPAAHLPVHDALGPGQRYIYFFGGCLSDAYPMPIRRLSDAYLTSIRWPIWRLSDGHLIFLIHIYYLSDGYPMPIWRLSGGIWWLPNVYWTPSTTYEMGIQWLSNGISFLLPEEANRWSCLQIPGGTKSLLLSFCFILVLPCPTI